MREHGTMDFDFRKRCSTVECVMGRGPAHQVIRYGVSAREYDEMLALDLTSPWVADQYDPAVRRPGRPVENEYGKQKFFFNKRIEVGDTVPFASDPNRGKVQVGAGSIDGAKEAELKEWRDSDDFGSAIVVSQDVSPTTEEVTT